MKKTILAALISLSISPGIAMASESVSVHISEPVSVSEPSFHETEEEPVNNSSEVSDSEDSQVTTTNSAAHVIIMNNNSANSVSDSSYHCTQTPNQEKRGEYTCTKTSTVTATTTTSDDSNDWDFVAAFIFSMAFFLWMGIIL